MHKNSRSGLKGNSAFKERIEALKKFKEGDLVVWDGRANGTFKKADLAMGNAIILIGKMEKVVNPLTLAHRQA